MEPSTRAHVVLCVIDALAHRHVGPGLTPHLWQMAESGGWARRGGVSVMSAATYSNHRSFVTGTEPHHHGIRVNADRHDAPRVDTLFSVAEAAGLSSVAVLGDQHLVEVMGATAASSHWPTQGEVPGGVPVDEYGYPTDGAVLTAWESALESGLADLSVVQLNDPDTAGHVHGPDSREAHERYRATDAVLGRLLDTLRPWWHDVVVMVVSDHDQETVSEDPPIDLIADIRRDGVAARAYYEGSAALLRHVADPADLHRWLDAHHGIEGRMPVGDDVMVWGGPGRWFAPPEYAGALRGVHGSPRTRTQVGAVGGGHRAVGGIAATLARRTPHATDWPVTAAHLLGLALPGAVGRSLL